MLDPFLKHGFYEQGITFSIPGVTDTTESYYANSVWEKALGPGLTGLGKALSWKNTNLNSREISLSGLGGLDHSYIYPC